MKTKGLSPKDVIKTTWLDEKLSGISKKFNSTLGLEHNKRWFCLDFTLKLLIYSSNESARRVSFIPFIDLRGVDRITDPLRINEARNGWMNGLVLTTTERYYELWSNSPIDRDNWVTSIARAIEIGRSIKSDVLNKAILKSTTKQFIETPMLEPALVQVRGGSVFKIDE